MLTIMKFNTADLVATKTQHIRLIIVKLIKVNILDPFYA